MASISSVNNDLIKGRSASTTGSIVISVGTRLLLFNSINFKHCNNQANIWLMPVISKSNVPPKSSRMFVCTVLRQVLYQDRFNLIRQIEVEYLGVEVEFSIESPLNILRLSETVLLALKYDKGNRYPLLA